MYKMWYSSSLSSELANFRSVDQLKKSHKDCFDQFWFSILQKDDQGGGYHPTLRSLISRNLSSAFCSHTTGRPGRAEQQQGKAGLNLDKKQEGGRGQASYPPTRRSNKAQQIKFKDNIQINEHTKI